ncbi:MAG: hypothetical protein AB4063_11480 [Crocosphaera sp.]
MTVIIDSLKQIVIPKYELSINSSKIDNSSIIIKETKKDTKLKTVEITGILSEHTYGFTLEGKKQDVQPICKYFDSKQKNINRVCDGIIFTQIENKNYVFFCELKSDRLTPSDYLVQYQNSTLFIDYLVKILNNFYLQEYQPDYKYLLFHTQTKQNSKARNITQPVRLVGVQTRKNPKSGFELDIYEIYREISKFEAKQGAKIKVNINDILKT